MSEESRKKPKQKRSLQMLDDILEGTKVAIDKFGIDKITTSKISDITGISVGSFYQYFKNKDFALVNLSKSFSSTFIKSFFNKLEKIENLPMTDLVEKLTLFYIDEMYKYAPYLKSMPRVIWKLGQSSFFIGNRKIVVDSISKILEKNSNKTFKECHEFSWLLVNFINGTIHHTFQTEETYYSKEYLSDFLVQTSKRSVLEFLEEKCEP